MNSNSSNASERFNKSGNVNSNSSSSSEDDMALNYLGNANFLAGLGDLSKAMPSNSSSNASKSTSSSSSEDDMGLGGLGNADFLSGLGDLPDLDSNSSKSDSKENSMMAKASMMRQSMAKSMMAGSASISASISMSARESASKSSALSSTYRSSNDLRYATSVYESFQSDARDSRANTVTWQDFYLSTYHDYYEPDVYDDDAANIKSYVRGYSDRNASEIFYDLKFLHFISELHKYNRHMIPKNKYAINYYHLFKDSKGHVVMKLEPNKSTWNLYTLFTKSVHDRKYHNKNIANNLFHNFINFINYYYSTHNPNSFEKPLGYVNYKQEKEKLGQQLIVLDRAYENSDCKFLKQYHFYSGSNILKYHMKITNRSRINAEDLYHLKKSIFADKNGNFSYTALKYSKKELLGVAKKLFNRSKNIIFKDYSMLLNTQCCVLNMLFNKKQYFIYNMNAFIDVLYHRKFGEPFYISRFDHDRFLASSKYLFRAINVTSNRYTGQGPSYLLNLGIVLGLNLNIDKKNGLHVENLSRRYYGFSSDISNFWGYKIINIFCNFGHIFYISCKKLNFIDIKKLIKLLFIHFALNPNNKEVGEIDNGIYYDDIPDYKLMRDV